MSKTPKSKASRKALAPDNLAEFSSCTPFPIIARKVKREWPDPHPRILAYRERGQQHKREVDDLLSRALNDGDSRAVDLLLRLAIGCTEALDALARERPELLRPHARKRITWPALISRKGEQAKINKWLMDEVTLGTESPHSGRWHPTSPATQQAQGLHNWLHANAVILKLSEISPETIHQWFETGWSRLMVATNNRPDQQPYLCEIGKSAVGKNSTKRGMSAQTEGMKRDDVIAKIKEELWDSFRSLYKFPPKRPPISGGDASS